MASQVVGPAALAVAVVGAISCWHGSAGERALLVQPDTDLAGLLTGLCAWALQAAAAWLALLLALAVVEPYAGRDLTSYAGCPARLRPVLLAACGAATLSALSVPVAADAADHPVGPARIAQQTGARLGPADGLPVPDRTTTPLARPEPTTVVRPGDSLWRITARGLPPGASDAAVAQGWRRLYERNRARIGADPDLIEPGIRLVGSTRQPADPSRRDHDAHRPSSHRRRGSHPSR